MFALRLVQAAGGDFGGACDSIASFAGIRRRFEHREDYEGGQLINDYAHLPEVIRAVLRAARRRFPGRQLFVVFQPHQHRRTLHLLDEFAAALSGADRCLIAEIYGAREGPEIRSCVSSMDLVEGVRGFGTDCEYAGRTANLASRILELRRPDDLMLILGAGDIDIVVDDLASNPECSGSSKMGVHSTRTRSIGFA